MTDQEPSNPLEQLRKIVVVDSKRDDDDAKDLVLRNRTIELENKQLDIKIQSLQEQIEDSKANREMRSKYAGWVYYYLVGYSVSCFVLLLLSGSKSVGFSLPETVLDFLVGSTAVSAIGLVYAVVQGLFNSKSSKS